MNDIIVFKNEIIKHAVFFAIICELISILFLGFSAKFSYGIILGTTISIVNFYILYFTIKKILTLRKGSFIIFLGYIVRLSLYGLSFYKCIQISYISAIGVVIGFLTIKISIYYTNGFKRKKDEQN
jgi:hypothetical protein